ncbi:hypothetical protein JL720_3111 [Aureococcus anophagefferens]|nr:hypothetical protein JL720_3111 [Aureococcus anophagefferens]
MGNPNVVVVQVIDTGIVMEHPDLLNNIWKNPGEICDNGYVDDGYGYSSRRSTTSRRPLRGATTRRRDPATRPRTRAAPAGPSATRMDREETGDLGRFAAAAAEVGLASTAVGSYRRKVGGHDLDVMLHAPGAPLVAVADYEFHDPDGAGIRLLARFFARLAAVDVGGAPFLHPHQNVDDLVSKMGKQKMEIRHCFLRSPAVPGAFRQVDFFLCPTEIIAHGLLGFSGSASFGRSLRDYVNHAHENNWAEVPDRRPIVGRRGWNNRITIARGKRKELETTYEECNINIRTEADVFRFFHLDYRAPHERCA